MSALGMMLEDVQRDLVPWCHRRLPDLTIACNERRAGEPATDDAEQVTCPDCIVAQEQIAEEKRP